MSQSSRPIKVLHVIEDLDIGGTEIGLAKLASALDKNVVSSIICTFRDGPVSELLRRAQIPVYEIRKEGAWDVLLLLKLIKFIRRNEIHIVHCRGGRPTVYGGGAAFLTRTPLVISVHGEKALQYPREVGCFKFFAHHCKPSSIISVSQHLRSEIYRRTGLKKSIRVIYNGINTDAVSVHSPAELREKRNGYLRVGAIGSLRPVKGYDLLLKAAPSILKTYPNTRFAIVGDGPSRPSLEALSVEMGISSHVQFLGYQAHISHVIPALDLVVAPSRSEGISNVLLEAMNAAIPVVATEVGGNREVVLAGKTGILVPPESPEAIAKAVCQLLANDDERKKMGQCGRRWVRERFDLRRTIRQYQQVYLDLVQK